MNIFVLAILGYLLYRFIGGFLIPLFRTSRQMHRHFQNMNGQQTNGTTHNGTGNMHSNGSTPGQDSAGSTGDQKSGTSKVGEYIDFEEIH